MRRPRSVMHIKLGWYQNGHACNSLTANMTDMG